jgi:hypothetical protein
MLIGSASFWIFCICVCHLLIKQKVGALLATIIAIPLWMIVSLSLELCFWGD